MHDLSEHDRECVQTLGEAVPSPLQATLDELGGGRFGQVVGASIEMFLKTGDRDPPVREQMLGQNTDGVPARIAKPAGDGF